MAAVAADLIAVMKGSTVAPTDMLIGLRGVGQLVGQRLDPLEAQVFRAEMVMIGAEVAKASGKPWNPASKEERQALTVVAVLLGFDATNAQAIVKTLAKR